MTIVTTVGSAGSEKNEGTRRSIRMGSASIGYRVVSMTTLVDGPHHARTLHLQPDRRRPYGPASLREADPADRPGSDEDAVLLALRVAGRDEEAHRVRLVDQRRAE